MATSFLSELGEVLHEEHFRILSLICGLENRVGGPDGAVALDPRKDEDADYLHELIAALAQIVEHNAFEEQVLFPMICAEGEGELASLLAQEHLIIGPLAREVSERAAAMLREGVDEQSWTAFRGVALTLSGEMIAHLQKEEMAVVQRLRVLLDRDADHTLAVRHREERSPTGIALANGAGASRTAKRGAAAPGA